MSQDRRLARAKVESRVARIRGWDAEKRGRQIARTYEFPSFPAAVRFVDFVAECAEAADHHPDIDIRYTRVRLALSTHTADGVTEKDFDLVRQIDQR